MAESCKESSKDLRALGKPAAPDYLQKVETLLVLLLQKLKPTHSNGTVLKGRKFYQRTEVEKPTARIRTKIRAILKKTRNYPNGVLMRVWSLSNEDNTSILLKQKKDNRCKIFAENTRCLAMKRRLVWEGMDSKQDKNLSSLEHRGLLVTKNAVSKFKFHLYFKIIPFRGSESWMALIGTWQNQCRPRKKSTQLRRKPIAKQDQDRRLQ